MESHSPLPDAPTNNVRDEEEFLPQEGYLGEEEDAAPAAQTSTDISNAGVVMADRQESCDFDDLEAASLPVIELPRNYESACRTSETTASTIASGTASYTTDAVPNSHDVYESLNCTTSTVVEEMTSGVVEAPVEGTMTLEDLEAAPIAHLVKDSQQLYDGGTMTAADSEGNDAQSDTSSQALPLTERRAEFISATIRKPKTVETLKGKDDANRNSQHDPLGMDLISNENGDVLISRIDPGSLIARTPFQIGDRLLSVNQKRCYVMDAKDVVQFMAALEGDITIVVHNEGGNPNYVESMITKPSLSHRCGLGLASTERHHLRISSIDAGGLFFDTLLNVGDPVVSINGEECEICDAQDAGDMIARAGIYITIKARTMLETGVVVAAFSCNNSTGSTIPPEVIHAINPDNNKTPTVAQLAGLTAIALMLITLLLVTGLLN